MKFALISFEQSTKPYSENILINTDDEYVDILSQIFPYGPTSLD